MANFGKGLAGLAGVAAIVWLVLCGGSRVSAAFQTDRAESFKFDPLDPALVLPVESDFNLTDREQKREFIRKKNEVSNLRKTIENNATNILAGAGDLNASRAEVSRFLTGLLLPEMTLADGDSLSKLADRRENLIEIVRDAPAGSPVREYLLNEVLLPTMSRIAEDDGYHPAVRLNAVLVIGGINEQEGAREGATPRPLGSAGQFLIRMAGSDEQPSWLRIGAMSGLIRHANLDGQLFSLTAGASKILEDSQRNAMIDLACALIEQVAGTDFVNCSDDQYWLTRQATQVVGGLARPGEGGKVVACLQQLLENEHVPTLLMCDAIAAYGGLQFTDATQADAARMAAVIGKRLSAMLLAEARTIDAYLYQVKEKKLLDSKTTEEKNAPSGSSGEIDDSSMSGGVSAGGRSKGQGGATPATSRPGEIVFPNYMINDVRQRAKAMTYVCRVALDGAAPRRRNEIKPAENLKKFADETTQQAIARLVAALDRTMDETSLATKSSLGTDLSVQGLEQKLKSILENSSANIDRIVEALGPKIGS